jgi:hypothetical protein
MNDRVTIPPVRVEDAAQDAPSGASPPAARYEPPTLRCVGNLRNLLGKTGPNRDFGSVFVHAPRRG